MISYAQNFEDVMLWRALKNVEKGFYIDVGANDPTVDSVTKFFYEQGWRGINIEPIPAHYICLQNERPRDINLNCASGPKAGEIAIWECDVRGWATSDQAVVKQHIKDGQKGEYHQFPMRTLADICVEYVKEDIHFLKVDVEGFEKDVLMGADFQLFRPWIIVIEATRPNSTEQIYEQWENLLTDADYLFAYADGLNRFYIAIEHSELLSLLIYPPNVFDDFVVIGQYQNSINAQNAEFKNQQLESQVQSSQLKTQQLESQVQSAQLKTQQLEFQLQSAQLKIQQLEAELTAVYSSSSFRITAPLRWLKSRSSFFKKNSVVVLSNNTDIPFCGEKIPPNAESLTVENLVYLSREVNSNKEALR